GLLGNFSNFPCYDMMDCCPEQILDVGKELIVLNGRFELMTITCKGPSGMEISHQQPLQVNRLAEHYKDYRFLFRVFASESVVCQTSQTASATACCREAGKNLAHALQNTDAFRKALCYNPLLNRQICASIPQIRNVLFMICTVSRG